MYVIALIAPKGGAGKGLCSTNLSVAASLAGQSVALVDLDPQCSASKWGDRRGKDDPAVISAQAPRLPQVIKAAKDSGVDYLLIDTAGRSDGSALEAARVADLVLTPCEPVTTEMETLPALKDLLALAGNPLHFVVLNAIHPASKTGPGEARELIREMFGLECVPTHLCYRSVYKLAATLGQGVQETEPGGRAAIEIERLYEFTVAHANARTIGHYGETQPPSTGNARRSRAQVARS
jgi:chromosome partitioning protein